MKNTNKLQHLYIYYFLKFPHQIVQYSVVAKVKCTIIFQILPFLLHYGNCNVRETTQNILIVFISLSLHHEYWKTKLAGFFMSTKFLCKCQIYIIQISPEYFWFFPILCGDRNLLFHLYSAWQTSSSKIRFE